MLQELTYEQLLKQEDELVFDTFNNDIAFELGMKIVERAKKEKKIIAVCVSFGRQILFQYGFIGFGPDAENWIRRKSNMVYEYHRSSMAVLTKWNNAGDGYEKFGRSPADFALVGGAFPIRIKDIGVIGAITVTGMPHWEDHEYVTTAIKEYLEK